MKDVGLFWEGILQQLQVLVRTAQDTRTTQAPYSSLPFSIAFAIPPNPDFLVFSVLRYRTHISSSLPTPYLIEEGSTLGERVCVSCGSGEGGVSFRDTEEEGLPSKIKNPEESP